jgi:MFS family permease
MLLGLTSGTALLLWTMVGYDGAGRWLLAVGIGCGAGSVFGLSREATPRGVWMGALAMAAMLLGGAALPLCVMVLAMIGGLAEPSVDWSWWRVAAYAILLVLLIASNARAADFRGPPAAVWMFFAVVAALVFVFFTGWRAVPTLLAERVGIRLAGTTTLLVPPQSCRLIASALSNGKDKSDGQLMATCEAPVSVVRAQVQLRWAGRMLLSIEMLNGVQMPREAARVTIPDADTHLALPASKG